MNNLSIISSPWRIFILLVGYTFVYAPIIILIIYSFNSSRLVTVWAGWSTKWYYVLVHDEAIISAMMLSMKLAISTASMAIVLGTISAFVIVRFGRFRGFRSFTFMLNAPLVMPDVITGLSLLLLFISLANTIGWPTERGMLTIWLAHVTFCTAYVSVIVNSRLREVDHSIEEAAMDLGATPIKVFFIITLPMIVPAIVSGWLLAFTLSIDDLMIANFVAGPGSTPLPLLIFSRVRMGVNPEINALATIIMGIVSLIGLIVWCLIFCKKNDRVYRQIIIM